MKNGRTSLKFHEKGIEEREIAKQSIISYLEGDFQKKKNFGMSDNAQGYQAPS